MPKSDADEAPPHDDSFGSQYEEEKTCNKYVESEGRCAEVGAVSQNI